MFSTGCGLCCIKQVGCSRKHWEENAELYYWFIVWYLSYVCTYTHLADFAILVLCPLLTHPLLILSLLLIIKFVSFSISRHSNQWEYYVVYFYPFFPCSMTLKTKYKISPHSTKWEFFDFSVTKIPTVSHIFQFLPNMVYVWGELLFIYM